MEKGASDPLDKLGHRNYKFKDHIIITINKKKNQGYKPTYINFILKYPIQLRKLKLDKTNFITTY